MIFLKLSENRALQTINDSNRTEHTNIKFWDLYYDPD